MNKKDAFSRLTAAAKERSERPPLRTFGRFLGGLVAPNRQAWYAHAWAELARLAQQQDARRFETTSSQE